MSEAWALGYRAADVARIEALLGKATADVRSPDELRRAIDALDGERNGAEAGRVRSVTASLHAAHVGTVDAALVAYALLELSCPAVPRRILMIRWRNHAGELRLHAATLWWNGRGRVGAFAKARAPGLGHRTAVFSDANAVAGSYARALWAAGAVPLAFGLARLEELAGDLDWRVSGAGLEVLASRLESECVHTFDSGDELVR